MTVYYANESVTLHHSDCLHVMREMPKQSVHSVITDPPYGLANTDPAHVVEALTRWASGERDFIPEGRGFMGKAWDAFVPPPAVWDECMRVLKPGGHLLAFAGSRTFDLMTLSIRFAGFDIRDSIAWLYGSGFPKSMNVSKAIDGSYIGPVPEQAAAWEGWGTALKPAFEPIVVARKPFPGTVAQNVLAHGTGALNIDATRVSGEPIEIHRRTDNVTAADSMAGASTGSTGTGEFSTAGRWPANVMLDESQAAALDAQSGYQKDGVAVKRNKDASKLENNAIYGERKQLRMDDVTFGSGGGASRFYYVAKAPGAERPQVGGTMHATVKPLDLMRRLIRLVTPPGGKVLEPFAGSGTTLEAALLEGFTSIGIEREADYLPLIMQRVSKPLQQSLLDGWDAA